MIVRTTELLFKWIGTETGSLSSTYHRTSHQVLRMTELLKKTFAEKQAEVLRILLQLPHNPES